VKHHRECGRSATSIAISSRIEPPGWMIAVTPAGRRHLDPVREGEVGVARHDRRLRPVARPAGGRSRRRPGGWPARPDPIVAPIRARTIAFDRTCRRSARRKSRSFSSSSVGRRTGDDLEPAAVQPDLVEALDEEAAGDALEVEGCDPVVAHPLGRVGRHGEDLEPGLALRIPTRAWL
jgi:hypothetical protein